jgi:Arc/MetJ-type ribon-helix-helix transcriptional regulator
MELCMDVQLAPNLQAEVDRLVDSGHFKSTDDVVVHGILLLLTAEGSYDDVQIGIAEANEGKILDHSTVFANLRSKLTNK